MGRRDSLNQICANMQIYQQQPAFVAVSNISSFGSLFISQYQLLTHLFELLARKSAQLFIMLLKQASSKLDSNVNSSL